MNQLLMKHPFRTEIEAFIQRSGIDPGAVFGVTESRLEWPFATHPGFSIILMLYEQEGEVYLWLECAIAKTEPQTPKDFYRFLLAYQSEQCVPFRTALNHKGLLVVQFRSYAGGITQQHLRIRLETLIPFAQELFKTTSCRFDLEPYFSAA